MTDLSTVLFSNTAASPYGTTRWMSPELLGTTHFRSGIRPSRESDCYAFGMTIYEVRGHLLFWSPHIYPPPGTQRSSAVPPAAVSRSCMRGARRGASGKAPERLISWSHRYTMGTVAVLLERDRFSATCCPAVVRLSSPGRPYLGTTPCRVLSHN